MSVTQSLPPEHQHAFAEFGGDGEVPRFCFLSDLDSRGRFGTSYVAVNDRRVVSFDAYRSAIHVPLEQLKEIKIDEGFGASQLVAVTETAEYGLARYSRNLVAEFALLCRIIDDLRAGREPILPDTLEQATCRHCNRPLPARGETCPHCVSRHSVALRLMGLLKPYRSKVAMLVAASSLGVGCAMIPPYTYKKIADRVLLGEHHDELLLWVGIMLAAFMCEGFFRFGQTWINAWLGARVVADLRSRLHAHTQRLRLSYHNKHESGELIGRVMHDTGELQHFLIDGMPYFLVNILSTMTIAVILVSMNWKLALLVFMPVPILMIGGRFFWQRLRPMFHQYRNRIGVLHTVLGESLNGIRAVKSLSQEQRRAGIFDHANDRLFTINTGVDRVFAGFFSSMSAAMALGTVLVWYFGGVSIIRASGGGTGIELGTLLAFAGYMALFYGPLQWFSAVFNWASNAMTSAERVFAVLDQPPEVDESPNTVRIERVRGAIAFKDVRFSYERGREVIKGITLDIEPGTMIGLVGKSGVGKSTLINLVCRFYDLDSGGISVDSHDLTTLDLQCWRKQFGIVMQEPFLFYASILDNIRYGRPQASFDQVVRAAKAAQAHGFICAKEEGYDTMLGEGGTSLSVGERQRLAIAQAILHDPPVLILDEATSAVDSETEKLIQEAIANLIRGRTTIAIAHRLATLRNADRLVVLEDGKIVEQGTHVELMDKEDGHFAKLVRLQTEINQLRAEQMSWSE